MLYKYITLRFSIYYTDLYIYTKYTVDLMYTIGFGVFFLICQYVEYTETKFCINSSVFGSIFFLTTGFHGFHVILGLVFLTYCLLRSLDFSREQSNLEALTITPQNHLGFEMSIWYWHFVDVIWLILYIVIYFWGS